MSRKLFSLSVPLFIVAVAAVAACDQSAGRAGGRGTDDLGASGRENADLAGQAQGGDDASSIDPGQQPDPNCHEEKLTPKKVGDPDIVILQDLSGSMADGMPSKYSQVSDALTAVLGQLDQKNVPIEWGLYFFPSDGACGVNQSPDVALAPKNGAKVAMAISANTPSGNTPTHIAVQNATGYFSTIKDGRGHYLLLATDGEPNCSGGGGGLPMLCMKDADCPKGQMCQMIPILGGICGNVMNNEAVMAITAARTAGIKTFVVGIDLGGDSTTLNAMATEGGTARAGATKYYPVTDKATLETALGNITSQIVSCSFALMSLPGMGQTVVVDIGGMMVKRDPTHMNGWDLDDMTKTLTFYGAACTSLQQNPGVVNVGYTCVPPG